MKSYFTFLSRNKLYTAIQFFGLAIALGVVLLLTLYAKTEFNIGNRQPYSHQLYAIGYGDGIGMTVGTAPELFPSIPEIKEWTRLINNELTDLTIDNNYYQVNSLAVDSNFFRLMDYPLIGCERDKVLNGTNEAIISEPFARKVFGNEDPIGRTIMYLNQTPLRVVGILPTFDPTELLKPVDLLVPIRLVEKTYSWMDNFGSTQTFVTLTEDAIPGIVTRKLLDSYKSYWDYWKEDNSTNNFTWGSSLTRMDEIYFSPLNHYTPFRNGTRKQVQILLAIAMILLLSAVFNYINLTVSQTGKRAHEMATRGEALNASSLSKLYRALIAQYFGPELVIDEEVQYEWARIPHFYSPFYVYKYATSYSAAVAISDALLHEGEPARKRYLAFLSLGGSMDPLEELQHAGVDFTSPAPVEAALRKFEEVLDAAEKLIMK